MSWNFSVEMAVFDTNSIIKKSSSKGNSCRFDGTECSPNIFPLMSLSGIKFLKWRFAQYAMIDERFFSNSFPLGFLKHLSTISFPDSLDKLNDERDVRDEDENCNLSLFSPLDLDFFFSFCHSILLSLCSTLYFFSFLLNCLVSLAYLVRKSLDFLIPSLLAHHMSYLQFYRFLFGLITEFTKTFTSYWSVCRESTSFKLCDIIYCIEYIFLNNISCCKNSTVPLCGQSRKKGWRIGLQAG